MESIYFQGTILQSLDAAPNSSMKGRVCVITGANSGIGKATALELAGMGATCVIFARNQQKGETAMSEITKQTGNDSIELLLADLSSLQSVRELAQQFQAKYPKLHVLINNAGLFNQRRHVTPDGYEATFAINYLAPFLLTNLLLPELKSSEPSRIVNVPSVAHYNRHIDFDDLNMEKTYGGWKAYQQSKLALVLFTHELARKLQGTGVTVNSVHPGTVATNIWSRPMGPLGFIMAVPKLFMISPERGAETIVYLASSDEAGGLNGEYLEKLNVKKSSDESYDEEIAQRLWDVSTKLTHLS